MVKTLTDKFKIGNRKRGKLDLVTAVNGKNYETKFNEIYSGIQSDREKYERLLNRYSDGEILKQEKKNYGFGKSVKRGLATLTAIAGLTLMGCPSPVGDPSDYEEPTKPTNPDNPDKPDPVEPIPDTDYVDISGRLQNDYTNCGEPGYLVITNKTDGSKILTHYVDGSNDGYFAVSLPKKVSELPDGISIEAQLGTESNPTSYKLTIDLGAGDHNPITELEGNPAIRPHRFRPGWTSQQINDFPKHAGRVNIWSPTERGAAGLNEEESVIGNFQSGLKKWNLGELANTEGHPIFQGIEVYFDDFNETEYTAMKTSIQNSGHPRANTITIQRSKNNYNDGNKGWIFIRKGSPGAQLIDQTGADGYLENVVVYLNPVFQTMGGILTDTDSGLTNHEVTYHAMSASVGHNNGYGKDIDSPSDDILELPNLPSIARYSSPYPSTSQEVDQEMYILIDDPTHVGMKGLDKLLGL